MSSELCCSSCQLFVYLYWDAICLFMWSICVKVMEGRSQLANCVRGKTMALFKPWRYLVSKPPPQFGCRKRSQNSVRCTMLSRATCSVSKGDCMNLSRLTISRVLQNRRWECELAVAQFLSRGLKKLSCDSCGPLIAVKKVAMAFIQCEVQQRRFSNRFCNSGARRIWTENQKCKRRRQNIWTFTLQWFHLRKMHNQFRQRY